MMKTMAMRALAIGAVLGFASTAGAQTASGLSDLIGARGSSAESELQSRGYEFATNRGSAALLWNPNTKACVSIAVDDGRAVDREFAQAGLRQVSSQKQPGQR